MTCHPLPDAGGRPSDQGSSHHMEHAASDCDALPSYESLEDLLPPPKIRSTDDPKERDETSAQPGHSCTISKYFNQYEQTIDLRMSPHPDVLVDNPTPQWTAVLTVKTSDVPTLMREGFFWSAGNVLPEQGYMSSETRPEWRALGFRHQRTWTLADKPNDGTPPQWVARPEVGSNFPEILAGFRVQSLSKENVYAASAWSGLQQGIYGYDCRWPRSHNYNCIYDDKPLRGWWPWPREEGDYVGFSALATELNAVGALSVVEDPAASRCQPQERHQCHEHRRQSSGCVIL